MFSVIIPLWNGASVILDCLQAIYENSGDIPFEVICVENASLDESAALVARAYPQVRLLREPVNLGFAGGVNAGIDEARGDFYVLLNQDCMVRPGWLQALSQAFAAHPEFGIAGCVIMTEAGEINHAGALIRRPDAYGVHLTELEGESPRPVEYVTGTMFAIRREAWEKVGRFDEGYYPAYYEESDYCYRARCKGYAIGLVPMARGVHLFSSREWRDDPVRHTANQHRARYRFVIKHFSDAEFADFAASELTALTAEPYFDQALGRFFAARDVLRSLADIVARRHMDGQADISSTYFRQIQVGFTQILRSAFEVSEKLGPYNPVAALSGMAYAWRDAVQAVDAAFSSFPDYESPNSQALQENDAELQVLQQREYDLMRRIYFKAPGDQTPELAWKRWVRLLVLRPLSFIIGRDYLLLSELNTLHVARMDLMARRMALLEENRRHDLSSFGQRMDVCRGQLWEVYVLLKKLHVQADRRLTLLEALTDYDYR